ncbi:pentapeptide repeat-containing protein [Sphaerisporangium sp. NPDC004334]
MIGLSTWLTSRLLLAEAGKDAALRVEAIKAGLTVGAGAGGAVALLLGFRKQWLAERNQGHLEKVAEENRQHQQETLQVNQYDATERRVTDLYAKAVEQLGHEKSAVRLGGMYALERLGQGYPEHRQTIINVICAYLKMPFDGVNAEQNAMPEQLEGTRRELQVRLAAEVLLTRHLHRGRENEDPPVDFWQDIEINLAGALLINADFKQCSFGDASFAGATFLDAAEFDHCSFTRDANFAGATFRGHAGFYGSEFAGSADFSKVGFEGGAYFIGASFYSHAFFDEVRFAGQPIAAMFDACNFKEGVTFAHSDFEGLANFAGATFADRVTFEEAKFADNPNFNQALASSPEEHSWPLGWKTGAESGLVEVVWDDSVGPKEGSKFIDKLPTLKRRV